MKLCLIVGLGGFIGAVTRYLISTAIGASYAFPLATFVCNVVGCFVIGVALGAVDRMALSADMKMFLVTGFCGALTTFSTFTNENLTLLRESHYMMFFVYVVLSVAIGLAATFGGYALSKI